MSKNKQAAVQAATRTATAVEALTPATDAAEPADETGVNIDHVEALPANETADTRIMLNLEGATSVSVFGKEWFVDEDGTVMVPADSATFLINDGQAVAVE